MHKWYYSTSSFAGAATLTARHRLRIAGMTRVEELQHKMRRQVAQYFSIVRLSACCASLVKRSTSVNSTTVKSTQYPHSYNLKSAAFHFWHHCSVYQSWRTYVFMCALINRLTDGFHTRLSMHMVHGIAWAV